MQTDHPVQSPVRPLLPPRMHKLAVVKRSIGWLLVVVKTVRTHLHGTKAWNGIHFNTAGQQRTPYLATDVVLQRGEQIFLRSGQPAAVVVKFHFIRNKIFHHSDLAGVVRIEEKAVHAGNGIMQFARFGAIGWQTWGRLLGAHA